MVKFKNLIGNLKEPNNKLPHKVKKTIKHILSISKTMLMTVIRILH